LSPMCALPGPPNTGRSSADPAPERASRAGPGKARALGSLAHRGFPGLRLARIQGGALTFMLFQTSDAKVGPLTIANVARLPWPDIRA
jgi:hypothetical protein